MIKLQRLFLFVLATASLTAAARLQGAWYSSGDLGLPAEITYDFEYTCQAELSHSDHPDNYAVAVFTFNNELRTVRSQDLVWTGVQVVNESEIEQDAPSFKIDSLRISLAVGSVETELALVTELSIAIGSVRAVNYESDSFTRDEQTVYAYNSVQILDAQDAPVRAQTLQVICAK